MTPSIEERVARLEATLEVHEAERQIRRTLDDYAHSLDYGEHDRWVDCFTPDGVWEWRYRDTTLSRLVGRSELQERMRTYRSAPDVYRKHMHWAPVITFISDSEARVVSYFAPILETASRPHFIVFGRFHDHVVRCDDGRWRFRVRVVDTEVQDGGGSAES